MKIVISWQPMTLNPSVADIEQINEMAQFCLKKMYHLVQVFPTKRGPNTTKIIRNNIIKEM